MKEKKEIKEFKQLGEVDFFQKDIQFFKSELPNLDYIVSNGFGFPWNRIILVKGKEGSGKTTFLINLCKSVVENGGVSLYFDAENKINPQWVGKFVNKNTENFIPIFAECMEEVFEKIHVAINLAIQNQTNNLLIVIDSMNALPTKTELEGSFSDVQYSPQARIASVALRKINTIIAQSPVNISLVLVSQLRDKIGVLYGEKTDTAWGNAPKFYASLSLDIRRQKQITSTDGGFPTGQIIEIRTGKNQIFEPYKETTLRLNYKTGFDLGYSYLEMLNLLNLIKKNGAWSSFEIDGETYKFSGLNQLVDILDNGVKDKIDKRIQELVNG